MAVELPKAFDPHGETDKILEKAKKEASKNFRWTSAKCLYDAVELGFLCHVLDRDEEALEVVRFVGQYKFAGNHSLWSAVEGALGLWARLARMKGEKKEAAECVKRIREADFVESRLEGSLLSPGDAERAQKEGSKSLERDYRLRQLDELCVLIELGGSKRCSVSTLGKLYQENLLRLRVLLGVKRA